jgi:KRAB domain-containing zinc finger protein
MCAWEGKVFFCDFCVKSFGKKSDMNWHINSVHANIGDFACRLCDKKRSGWTVHERVHTGGKPYKCLNCGKSFKHKVQLNGHMNNHLGIKEF